jgi:hypothetical protein
MRAMRGLFFFLGTCSGCFVDSGVKKEIAKTARIALAIFTVLFVVAEAMELMS